MGMIRTFFKKVNNFIFDNNSSSATSAPASAYTAQPYSAAAPANNVYPTPAATRDGWLAQMCFAEEDPVEQLVYNRRGEPLQLGSQFELASGGEGVVYTFPHDEKYLIKIYKKNAHSSAEKRTHFIEQMRTMINEDKYRICRKKTFLAWPQMPVYDANHQLIGFVMNKCSGKSLGSLKSPALIGRIFPHWDRLDLAKVALDFVRKVSFLAENGVYVNDFNPENFLVDEAHNVSFIDCASFQVQTPSGQYHTTGTFFASHIAPELVLHPQNLLYPRNIHHVEFGTAIVVFNILMYGLHPYSYYDFNRKSGCADPDTNLKKGRCPLGIGTDCKFPTGDWQKHWSWLTYDLKSSFIKTFRDGHRNPAVREPLRELEKNLQGLIHAMGHDHHNQGRRSLSPAVKKKSEYEGQRIKPEDLFQNKYQ